MRELRKCRACGVEIQSNAPFGHCPQCLIALGFGPAPENALQPLIEPAPLSTPSPPREKSDSDPNSASQAGSALPGDIIGTTCDRIGRYKLLEKIGEGGGGLVYMAEQEEPVRRRVALKVLKPGMDTREVIARFEAERQALALMDHPHIARIFDGGATETGRPYFVMELVRGLRITDYCDQKKLSTKQRLDLFVKVCQAVQHAHQKGIIHRDLKPSNVMVTVNDGVAVPKVIDFGVAKATGQRLTDKTLFTKFQQFLGTPAYMSPEQAEMTSVDIDTRSDIYSLGVLLYELLTSRIPFDTRELLRAGMEAMLRTIREQDPVRPSARLITLTAIDQTTVAQQRQTDGPKLINMLRGDLDWIVMKCLDKDRARRYETANGLAADIQRHLGNVPVLASPPGNLYRIRKTVCRYKLPFAAAGAVLASLVIGLGVAGIMFLRERAERRSGDVVRAEVVQKNTELELKNTEYRAMLVEAARSDRFVAEDKLRSGQEQAAFSHLARACEYDPSSSLAAEMAAGALGSWNHELPLAILQGHTNEVYSAQFNPAGTRIVTASRDRTARVWDVATGRLLRTLVGHSGRVVSAEFSPDGTRIVTASNDHTARVWDPVTGEMLATLSGHTEALRTAHFSPDGSRIVTLSPVERAARVWDAPSGKGLLMLSDQSQVQGIWMTAEFSPDGRRIVTAGVRDAFVWDAVTGEKRATLAGHTRDVRSASFNAEGTRIVTASWDGTARVWDTATGGVLATLAGHGGDVDGAQLVESAQFSPDGTRIVTAGRGDKTVRIWETTTGKLLKILAGHEGEVHGAQFSPEGDRVVSMSWSKSDGTARIWDASTGKALATLAGHQAEVWTLHFSAEGTRIVTASWDGTARVWDIGTMRATLAKPYRWVVFSPEGTRIITASREKKTAPRVWETATGKALATLVGHTGELWSVQFSLDGTFIVTAWRDKTARVWDSATGKALATLAGHTGEVWSAQFSPDGTRVATTSDDKTVRLWETATGRALATFAGCKRRSWLPQFSPDGTRVATTSDDRSVRIWEAATGKALATLAGHTGEVWGAQFSPNGRRIITSSLMEPERLWDATTGEMLAKLGDDGWANIAQFSPDGKRVITTPGGAVSYLWDSSNGTLLEKLAGHTGVVTSARFSPGGAHIVTASRDKTARVWDATTSEPLATLAAHEDLRSAQFSSDGTRIVTTSNDGTVRLWDVLPNGAGPPPEWLPDFLRYLAQMRLNPDGELERIKLADWFALRERLRGVLRASAGGDTLYLSILRRYVRE